MPITALSRIAIAALAAACAGQPPARTTTPPAPAASAAAAVPVDPTTPTGDVHDFDFIAGAWTTRQHRLKQRGVGSTQWDEFPATLCATSHLGGMVNVDELVMPTKGWSGLTVRTFDLQTRRWSIYWVSSRNGRLDPGRGGGFTGAPGEFHGVDTDDGRPVKVRYVWTRIDPDHAHWEQAFSYDNGAAWEVNWTADFTRADTAKTCRDGRPRS